MSDQLHIRAAKEHEANNITKAKSLYIEALNINPNVTDSWNNLGMIFKSNKDFVSSLICFRKAVSLQHNNTTYLTNLGCAQWHLKHYEKAKESFEKVISINPALTPIAYHTLAYIKWISGDIDSAKKDINEAIQLSPQTPELIWDKALIDLSAGDFQQGWIGFEARFKNPAFNYLQMINIPMWNGEDLSNKKLYLHAEQGLGDIIQFSRFVRNIRPLVKDIRFDVPYELKRLFEYSFRDLDIEFKIMFKDTLPTDCDYHLPLCSLPLRLDITIENLDGCTYLEVPKDGIPIKRKSKNKAVGIVWAGDPKHDNDIERSANFLDFVESLGMPGIDLYSLQVGTKSSDIVIAGLDGLIPDYSKQIRDMVDTASIMKQLDCIVTVDTAVSHLAGAIGVPFYVVTPYHLTDWRWMLNRSDSPWYESGQIYRQEYGENYKIVLAKVANSILQG